jgi:MFS family permease
MYTEDDLRTAVASGAISAEAADALRNSVRTTREAPATDEEHFRLINSFNDIFVTIAAVLLLVAMGGIGQIFTPGLDGPPPVSGLLIAAAAWGMAEYFTRQRRMALPSIVLLLAFVGGVFVTLIGSIVMSLGGNNFGQENPTLIGLLASGAALVTAGAAWMHWKRFMVPITIAAGAAALAATAIGLIVTAVGPTNVSDDVVIPLVFAAGIAVFIFAMRWDMTDRERQTRRSDVAFWLHLLAAPMIAHPLFHWLGVTGGENIGMGAAIGVLVVYVALGIVALAIDRRALLVSALAYVLAALTFLFDRFGAVELNVALTALVIGSALLTLSAFWSPIRRTVVTKLPNDMQERLPQTLALPA